MHRFVFSLSILLLSGLLSSCVSMGSDEQPQKSPTTVKSASDATVNTTDEPVEISNVALQVDAIGRYVITGTLTNTSHEARDARLTLSVMEEKAGSSSDAKKEIGVSKFDAITSTGIFFRHESFVSLTIDPSDTIQIAFYPYTNVTLSDDKKNVISNEIGLSLKTTYSAPQLSVSSTPARSATENSRETCDVDDVAISFSPSGDFETEVTAKSKEQEKTLRVVHVTLYGTDSDGNILPLSGFYGDEETRPVGMHTVDVSFDYIGAEEAKTFTFSGRADWKVAAVTCTKS